MSKAAQTIPEPIILQETVYRCRGCGITFSNRDAFRLHADRECTADAFTRAGAMVGSYVLFKDLDGCGRVSGRDGCLLDGMFFYTNEEDGRYEIIRLPRKPHVSEVVMSTADDVRSHLSSFLDGASDRLIMSLLGVPDTGGADDE